MSYKPNDNRVLDWVRNGIQSDDAIKWADEFASHLIQGGDQKLTTSQLRKFFGQLKRLQATGYNPEDKQALLMLKPQLAYAVGRAKRDAKIKDFADELGRMISEVAKAASHEEGKKRFHNFISLTEAIVAYHKARGGE
jgi:CRISPR type III-A-associated protein Csm2